MVVIQDFLVKLYPIQTFYFVSTLMHDFRLGKVNSETKLAA